MNSQGLWVVLVVGKPWAPRSADVDRGVEALLRRLHATPDPLPPFLA